VAFVYPGAHHDRFEHSLGVYRMALLFLRQLAHQERFSEVVSARSATVLILAALLHDIGHWPFCHPLEDLSLARMPTHEQFADIYLKSDRLHRHLKEDWRIEPEEILDLINKRSGSPSETILSSILSSPIDIDKMDYLYRDSLHAGVPYGQNFDAPRLIGSLCLNRTGDRLAITHKGKTAAELMVFARYVMFSEVYWHHAVRSATSMFQRAFYRWYQVHLNHPDFEEIAAELFRLSETEMIRNLQKDSDAENGGLIEALFGDVRKLYKRLAAYSCFEGEPIYRRLARKPYPWLVELGEKLAGRLSALLKRSIPPDQILIDAPPIGLEVQFDVDVFYPAENRYVALETVSPVVQTLAKRQFDDYVKQVRIFVQPDLEAEVNRIPEIKVQIDQWLIELAEEVK
jgi:uncharacterized protein